MGEEPPTKPPIQPPFLGRNTLTFPKGYLELGELDPALEGTFKVKDKDGKTVTVRPVFDTYKEKIMKEYTPEKVSKITGVNAQVITRVAREYAGAKPAMIITGAGINHWFYADVNMRSVHFLGSSNRQLRQTGRRRESLYRTVEANRTARRGCLIIPTEPWKTALLPDHNMGLCAWRGIRCHGAHRC